MSDPPVGRFPPRRVVPPCRVAVVGAGASGIATALLLQLQGHRVSLFDTRWGRARRTQSKDNDADDDTHVPSCASSGDGNAAVWSTASCEPSNVVYTGVQTTAEAVWRMAAGQTARNERPPTPRFASVRDTFALRGIAIDHGDEQQKKHVEIAAVTRHELLRRALDTWTRVAELANASHLLAPTRYVTVSRDARYDDLHALRVACSPDTYRQLAVDPWTTPLASAAVRALGWPEEPDAITAYVDEAAVRVTDVDALHASMYEKFVSRGGRTVDARVAALVRGGGGVAWKASVAFKNMSMSDFASDALSQHIPHSKAQAQADEAFETVVTSCGRTFPGFHYAVLCGGFGTIDTLVATIKAHAEVSPGAAPRRLTQNASEAVKAARRGDAKSTLKHMGLPQLAVERGFAVQMPKGGKGRAAQVGSLDLSTAKDTVVSVLDVGATVVAPPAAADGEGAERRLRAHGAAEWRRDALTSSPSKGRALALKRWLIAVAGGCEEDANNAAEETVRWAGPDPPPFEHAERGERRRGFPWAGHVLVSSDGLPLVGPLPELDRPTVLLNIAHGGVGMTGGVGGGGHLLTGLAALDIADRINGGEGEMHWLPSRARS